MEYKNNFLKKLDVKNYKNEELKMIKLIIELEGDISDYQLQETLFKKLIKKYSIVAKTLEKTIDQVTYISETDPLTKVYNRLKFNKELDGEIEKANYYNSEFSIIMFDIDYFKKINDTYGHPIGDDVLVNLTQCVKKELKHKDVFSRWGGDEFIILLPDISKEEAFNIATVLKDSIFNFKFKKIGNVSCSFGVVSYNLKESSEKLLQRVDLKLYKAKENGKGRVEK